MHQPRAGAMYAQDANMYSGRRLDRLYQRLSLMFWTKLTGTDQL